MNDTGGGARSAGPAMLIIGSTGFLGAHMVSAASQAGYQVIRGERRPAESAHSAVVDITVRSSVEAAIRQVRPAAVILLAAMSDIDRCEACPELAWATNVEGPGNVARACADTGARLLFTSSGAVFDGTRHGYSESDQPTPLSVYGKTKADAERVVAGQLPSALIARFGLVIGFAGRPGTNSMLDSLAQRWGRGATVAFPTFEYRNPIDAGTLCGILLELLKAAPAGLYHVGSSDAISRYELGLRLARRMGYPSGLVQPQTSAPPGRAPRGLDHFLLTDKIRSVCRAPIPSCDEAIERSFHGSAQSNI